MTTQAPAEGYRLSLPVFEGPLDLLLHLIEREELDITKVALVSVADQYMAYVHAGDQLNLDALADFIAIGAKLLYLKSRALLPRPLSEDEDDDDVGDDLARRLLEYKRFKEAAGRLRAIETEGLHAFPRVAPPPDVPPPPGLDGVTLDLLQRLVERAIARKPEEEPVQIIRPHKVTVSEKMSLIRETLATRGRASFLALVEACRTRMDVVVTFLAVLELIKSRVLEAQQDAAFSDIVLLPAEEAPLDAPMSSEFDD